MEKNKLNIQSIPKDPDAKFTKADNYLEQRKKAAEWAEELGLRMLPEEVTAFAELSFPEGK